MDAFDAWEYPAAYEFPGLHEQAQSLWAGGPEPDVQERPRAPSSLCFDGGQATNLHLVELRPLRLLAESEVPPHALYGFGGQSPDSTAADYDSDDSETVSVAETPPSSLCSLPCSPVRLVVCVPQQSTADPTVPPPLPPTVEGARAPKPPTERGRGRVTVELVPRKHGVVPGTVVSGFARLPVPVARETIESILKVFKLHTGCRGKVTGPVGGHPAVDPDAGDYLIEIIGDYCNYILVQTLVGFGIPSAHICLIRTP